MPYDNPAMGAVAGSMDGTEPSAPGPGDMHEDAPPGGDDTAYIPPTVTGGKKFEAGDQIILDVVSVDEDGSLEVKYPTDGGGESPKPGDSEIDALPD